jgi:hypothetical protein
MTHAFFADMGGFVLRSPDFPPFPLDAEQLYYLISNDYLEYPKLDKAIIDDKNKADGLARYAIYRGSVCCKILISSLGSLLFVRYFGSA